MDNTFLDDFSREVWQSTYKHHTDNNLEDTFRRVANAIASVESPDNIDKYEDLFFDMLSGFKVTVGGRIFSNAGTNWQGTTLMNCFVGPKPKYDQDSLEGIFGVLLAQAKTLKSEGGWGMNFSFIRPRGAFIKGIGVESPGAVKYMELFDKSSDIITAGSGRKSDNKTAKGKIRKGAMMAVLDVWHPDIQEYITAKLTAGRLSKFNISVNCSNEFMDKVSLISCFKRIIETGEYESLKGYDKNHYISRIEELEKWELIFPDTNYEKYKEEWDGNIQKWKSKGYPVISYGTIKVSDLWELITRSTYERNDPGVLFLDNANATHCWNYGEDAYIAATNPCGEQCLPFGGVCNLGSVNLTQFVDLKNKCFDLDMLKKYVPILVRFLDNVNSYTKAPLLQYEESIIKRRRIGIGILGWGSALYLLNVRFGSDEAEKIKAELMKCLTHSAVEASIDLAIEKGKFVGCENDKHADANFWFQIALPIETRNRIRQHGIRNSALFSIQPTGNTSILANIVSGGLEPVFLHEYIRTSIVNGCPEDLKPLCPKYWEGEFKETPLFKLVKEGDEAILRGEHKGTVYKIDKNRGLTKETLCEDYAVRYLKSVNEWDEKADWAVTTEQLSVAEHIRDMEGFGRWIDSSMSKTVNIPNSYPFDKFKDVYLNAYKTGFLKGITTYRAGTMTTVLSAKEDKKGGIIKTEAPKRDKELVAEIYTLKYKKEDLYVAIGFCGTDPYEIFVGVNPKQDIEHAKGKIIKNGRGKYLFITEDGKEHHLNNGHSDENGDALCRTLSAALRHGCDLSFLVHQLEKTQGDLMSFSKVICRVLKKFIKKDTKISGEECPQCKSELIRVEGCKKCKSCDWSAC